MREQFQIQSAEDLPIRGVVDLPEAPRSVVVVVHGFKGFKDWGFFPWVGERLRGAVAAVVRFDMSRNGIGERPGELDRLDLFADGSYSTELADLGSVLSWVASHEILSGLPLFLLGHSRGGGIAILAAAASPEVRGVITWSAIAKADRWDEATKQEWRRSGHLDIPNSRTGQVMRLSTRALDDLEAAGSQLDILAAAGRLTVPVLHVHGVADETVHPTEAEHLASRGKNSSLVLIANGTHTFGAVHPFAGSSPELRFAMQASLAFIHAYCRGTRIVNLSR
ncbi:MAG: alpha/beta hydrolase family protein [Thermoanaerobaculia bacterium]